MQRPRQRLRADCAFQGPFEPTDPLTVVMLVESIHVCLRAAGFFLRKARAVLFAPLPKLGEGAHCVTRDNEVETAQHSLQTAQLRDEDA